MLGVWLSMASLMQQQLDQGGVVTGQAAKLEVATTEAKSASLYDCHDTTMQQALPVAT